MNWPLLMNKLSIDSFEMYELKVLENDYKSES